MYHKQNVGRLVLKVFLMRSQMKMNMLLETGGREPCYKVAKNLAVLYSSVLCKVELVSDKLK